jgi:hypothetical protein
MDAGELCQQLLDHVVKELPEEREAAPGLTAMLTFHPTEVRDFVVEVMVLLLRNDCPLPDHLVPAVSRRVAGPRAVEQP